MIPLVRMPFRKSYATAHDSMQMFQGIRIRLTLWYSGVLALAFPELLSGGYGWVQWGAIGMPPRLTLPPYEAFEPQMNMRYLLILALLKPLATGLTISSGGSGGASAPGPCSTRTRRRDPSRGH